MHNHRWNLISSTGDADDKIHDQQTGCLASQFRTTGKQTCIDSGIGISLQRDEHDRGSCCSELTERHAGQHNIMPPLSPQSTPLPIDETSNVFIATSVQTVVPEVVAHALDQEKRTVAIACTCTLILALALSAAIVPEPLLMPCTRRRPTHCAWR